MTAPRIVYQIELTPEELDEAKHYARLRREYHRGPGVPVPWEELMGTIGEMAVAKHFGDEYLDHWRDRIAFDGGPDNAFQQSIPADVGRNVQVRTVDSAHRGLAVRRSDPPSAAYIVVLTTPENPGSVLLLGWMYGHEAARVGRWMEDWPRPAWRVSVNHKVHIQCMSKFPLAELEGPEGTD